MNDTMKRFVDAERELNFVRAFLDGIRLGNPDSAGTTVDRCWQAVNNAQHCLNTAAGLAQHADKGQVYNDTGG